MRSTSTLTRMYSTMALPRSLSLEAYSVLSLCSSSPLELHFLVSLDLWAYGQVQQLSKAPKVELGTGTTDANIDEWLERSKSKKKPFVSCRLASPSPASWFLSDFWVPDVSSIFFFWKRTSFGLLTFPFPHFISSPVCRRGEGGLSDLLPLAKAKQGRKPLLTRACRPEEQKRRRGGMI